MLVEGKGGISAKMIEDSVSNGIRLTTMQLRYPRFILSELNTHRQFSRNSSSSRAIPVKKMIGQVKSDPAMPIHWGANQKGMQANEEQHAPVYIYDDMVYDWCKLLPEEAWSWASEYATDVAEAFADAGYHKQVVNRLLEPFQFMNTIVTATEWDNFFKLRLHKDAQPEIYELARVMKQCMDNSVPNELQPDEWHIPYVSLDEHATYGNNHQDEIIKVDIEEAIKCSVARCARVSYLNHDQSQPDIQKDIALHDMLLEAGHMSPFEHIARPMEYPEYLKDWQKGITHMNREGFYFSGNLRGWIQYRQLLGE